MKGLFQWKQLAVAGAAAAACAAAAAYPPLAQHRSNPHYFMFRGRPAALIGSGEHYGAVINRDFDYARYLRTLERDRLNLTRTFSGAYFEPPGAFRIAGNTLAPPRGRYIGPWARSRRPGAADGGPKFDLDRWNPAYFKRLKGFVELAGKCGVVVEMNLFCPFYGEAQWRLSPMNGRNNVNGAGNVARTNVYTLDRNGGLLRYQEALTRKIVTELAPFDNVYYEICNEPYFGGVTLAWQRRIAQVIATTEKGLGTRHLISRNVANGSRKVTDPSPLVAILNFHYAFPPAAVAENYRLNRVIGDNETGFRGTNNAPYRIEGWHFLLAGGGLFNHLDYSFAAGHEGGDFAYPSTQPGGGNALLRRQLRGLREFIESFDFLSMRPVEGVLPQRLPAGFLGRVLGRPGAEYAIYVSRDRRRLRLPETPSAVRSRGETLKLRLRLPAGEYAARWYDPLRAAWSVGQTVRSEGKRATELRTPRFLNDIALSVRRRGGGKR
ncbi:MAG: hypothetical protein J7M29_06190 [Verrucomicrobia bacterium]|nr:hypothetical protein [Verrucomicrobiota bacterium]